MSNDLTADESQLTEQDYAVLRMCNQFWFSQLSKRTYSESIERLTGLDMLEIKAGAYRTTNKGRDALKERKK